MYIYISKLIKPATFPKIVELLNMRISVKLLRKGQAAFRTDIRSELQMHTSQVSVVCTTTGEGLVTDRALVQLGTGYQVYLERL